MLLFLTEFSHLEQVIKILMGSYSFPVPSNQLWYWRNCQKGKKKKKENNGELEENSCKNSASLSQGERVYLLGGLSESSYNFLHLRCLVPRRTLQLSSHQSCSSVSRNQQDAQCTLRHTPTCTHPYFSWLWKKQRIALISVHSSWNGASKPLRISRMLGVSSLF